MALDSTQPLTEMVPGFFFGGKGWQARKADVCAICENLENLENVGALDVSQSYGPPRLVTGLALSFLMLYVDRQLGEIN
jgi:hypothetical protein